MIFDFNNIIHIFILNPFPAQTAPFALKLPPNPGELSLAKGIAMFVSAFLSKLPNQEPKDPLDWIILDI